MEQFRQIGEVVGSLKALMVFKDDLQINYRQCSLLLDILSLAYHSIGEEMRQNLKFEERNTKWKVLEQPLRELLRVYKEGEIYVRQCLETRDWWAKAIALHQNKDCVEFHINNLLCCVFVVIEAIETVGETSGWDHEEIQKKKVIYAMKYQKDCKDPKLFQWRYGKDYLVSQDLCNRFNSVWEEDRWILVNKVQEKKIQRSKQDQRLADVLLKNLSENDALEGNLLPCSILVGSRDYQVRRRLGSGSQYKEIQWLGESFALRHFFGNIEPLICKISRVLSLSHPNIMQFFCGFTDEEKKECFLVMELMNRDLSSFMKEICGPRRRVPFSLPVAVDLMLQIAQGMEYLHLKKIFHGDLNPSNILVKSRNGSTEGYLHAKVSGFGLTSSISQTQKASSSGQNGTLPFIWYSPEVLAEQEQQQGNEVSSKQSEKSDVYSFGMICFQLLTGKVPFEDSHLQGDKMSRNIRAGERPLFPHSSPKYVTNLTKKCWHIDPDQRPSFLSICRILRYIKRFLLLNPDHSQPDPPLTMVDYWDIEMGLLKRFPCWGSSEVFPLSQIPFQMFAYRVMEKERLNASTRENSESGSDWASACGDENVIVEDFPERKSCPSPEIKMKRVASAKKLADVKTTKQPVDSLLFTIELTMKVKVRLSFRDGGTPRGRSVRPPQLTPSGRTMRMNSESQLLVMSPRTWRTSGHMSDSELS